MAPLPSTLYSLLSAQLPASLSDDQLLRAARQLAALHSSAEGADRAEVERAMERVFTPLWQRVCDAEGNTLVQWQGIKAIYDCRPAGLWGIDAELCTLQRTLIDVLSHVAKRDPSVLSTLLEIIVSAPLCRIVRGKDGSPKYANTPGMKLYRSTLAAWAATQLPDGSWPDADAAEASRRKRLLSACAELSWLVPAVQS